MRKVKELLEKANGWQRAWIVFSIVWLICAIVFVAIHFPTQNTMQMQLLASRSSDPILTAMDPKIISEHCKAKFSMEFGECLVTNSYGERVKAYRQQVTLAQERENRYIEENLFVEQWKTIGSALLFWLVSVLTVYALGVAGAWIARGFRK